MTICAHKFRTEYILLSLEPKQSVQIQTFTMKVPLTTMAEKLQLNVVVSRIDNAIELICSKILRCYSAPHHDIKYNHEIKTILKRYHIRVRDTPRTMVGESYIGGSLQVQAPMEWVHLKVLDTSKLVPQHKTCLLHFVCKWFNSIWKLNIYNHVTVLRLLLML